MGIRIVGPPCHFLVAMPRVVSAIQCRIIKCNKNIFDFLSTTPLRNTFIVLSHDVSVISRIKDMKNSFIQLDWILRSSTQTQFQAEYTCFGEFGHSVCNSR